MDIDLKVKGPSPWTHADVKQPVGSEALRKQGQTISVEEMAQTMGKKIVAQKHRFVGLENGPVSSKNVCHVVDLCYVPLDEKLIVKQNVLQGAADKAHEIVKENRLHGTAKQDVLLGAADKADTGSGAGIVFLNDI